MKISDIHFIILTSPYYEAGGLRNYGMVALQTEDGLTGLGEPYAGVNMPTVCKEAIRLLKPLIVGQDALGIDLLMERLHGTCEYFDHRGLIYCLLGAVEWALADLAAQRAKIPLHRLLSKTSAESIEPYASTGPASWTPEHVVEDLDGCFQRGFRIAKIRAGCCMESLDQAIARCKKVAQRIPRGMRLGVDAGQQIIHRKCWDLSSATQLAQALSEDAIAFLEDPLLIHDREGYVALRKLKLVPIAGGEMFAEPEQFEDYIQAGAFDLAQPDATVLSGPRACMRVLNCARQHDVRVAMHAWAGPVGQMQNIHAALASDVCDLVEITTFSHPLMEEMIAPLWKLENGRLQAPLTPGLGIALTQDIEQRYAHQPSVVNLIA